MCGLVKVLLYLKVLQLEMIVCGMRSIVTKDVPDNSLVVGSPARIIKRGISWKREYITI